MNKDRDSLLGENLIYNRDLFGLANTAQQEILKCLIDTCKKSIAEYSNKSFIRGSINTLVVKFAVQKKLL